MSTNPTVDKVYEMVSKVIATEGGYSDHPLDRGGPTNMGITLRALTIWRGKPEPATAADIKELTEQEARDIYVDTYWSKPGLDKLGLPMWAVAPVFDAAVLHGPHSALKMLQQAAGVVADGAIGAKTLYAIHNMNHKELTMRFLRERILYLGLIVKRNPKQSVFLVGWLDRVTKYILEVSLTDPLPWDR